MKREGHNFRYPRSKTSKAMRTSEFSVLFARRCNASDGIIKNKDSLNLIKGAQMELLRGPSES